tara:strand:- start:383 stop:835 length:453 start_codon:yes stop_codon:yes gene_type:complete
MNVSIYKRHNEKFKQEEELNKIKLNILKDLFSVLHINIESKFDLINVELDRSCLLSEPFYSYAINYKKNLKKIYKSSNYNCLHSNSETKQKFPSINLIRQVLKSNQLRLYPHYRSLGYDDNKKKIVQRYFIIQSLDEYTSTDDGIVRFDN